MWLFPRLKSRPELKIFCHHSGYPTKSDECVAMRAEGEGTIWSKENCGSKLDGFVCEHDILEPKYVGCHAHLKEAPKADNQVKLREEDSNFKKIEDCRLFCQGKPYFDLTHDLNCSCRTVWPSGGKDYCF